MSCVRPGTLPKRRVLPVSFTTCTLGDLDAEHQLDRGLDVRLGRIAAHAERVRIVVLHRQRGLLGDVRREQDVDELFLARDLLRRVLDVDDLLALLRRLGGLRGLRGLLDFRSALSTLAALSRLALAALIADAPR